LQSLFISDLHLSEDRPAANERFFAFIEDTGARADALYVLGDLFEYWIGDDDLANPFNGVIAGFFRRLTEGGTRLYFMHGNRDFLVADGYEDAVREALRRHNVSRLVHGHTHRPGRHRVEVDGRPCERWVIPDWYGNGGFVELKDGKLRLERW